jgi:predicted TIM-barrel fold metal-dependent hydrolase
VKRLHRFGIAVLLIVGIAVAGVFLRHRRTAQSRPFKLTGSNLEEFRSIEPIDAHTHVFQTSPELIRLFQRLHIHTLDILYVDDQNPYLKELEPQKTDGRSFVASSVGLAQLCTTFNPFQVGRPRFPNDTIAELNRDFANGAVAAKIWKNIGMEIVDSSGRYLMADDPIFEPVYKDIAAQGKTLIIHSADPDEAWGLHPPGSSTKYYEANPQWDMSKKSGAPDKQTILKARDHLLAGNPDLRVVGAHFGSMEDHLDEVADRFDRYPNFAVDTAARVSRLVFQPRDKVRAFFLKYQDRILYGTDLHLYAGAIDPGIFESWEKQYARDWRYFATDDTFEYLGQRVEGLNLPRPVLKKLYHDNAVRWIPGIVAAPQ